MSSSLNRVMLIGNVGKDPETTTLNDGTLVVNFALATSTSYKDKSGELQGKTEWHNCKSFGRVAEIIRDYVKKGHKLYAEGPLETRSWDDKESGKKIYRTEIKVLQIKLLSGLKDGATNAASSERQIDTVAHVPSPTKHDNGDYPYDMGISEDDIPY